MDIDPDISNWILEYLLTRPLEDRTLNSILATIPFNNDNLKLQRLLLLRKLELEASRHNSSSETALELLEHLEEIVFRRGDGVLDSMKHAYCAVAVQCTVKHLLSENQEERSKKSRFFEAVKKVWRGKIGRMEKVVVDNGGLLSEEFLCWKDEIETAVWEDSVRERVIEKSREINADNIVFAYINEERVRMGPSFLEMVAERAVNDGFMQGILGMDDRKEGTVDVGGDMDVDDGSDGKEVQKEKTSKRKSTCFKRLRRVNIVDTDTDTDEVPAGPSKFNYHLPSSAVVDKVREALRLSSLELRAVVKDPLPSALRIAETITGMARENKDYQPVEETCVEANTFIVGNARVVQASVSRQSSMERNHTARTYEWDNSVVDLEKESEDGQRIPIPSPNRLRVSPLKNYETITSHRRRKPKKWSTLEVDTLRAGVQKYGTSNWALILRKNLDIFVDRTGVDLKDKWRNLMRATKNSNVFVS